MIWRKISRDISNWKKKKNIVDINIYTETRSQHYILLSKSWRISWSPKEEKKKYATMFSFLLSNPPITILFPTIYKCSIYKYIFFIFLVCALLLNFLSFLPLATSINRIFFHIYIFINPEHWGKVTDDAKWMRE